MKYNFDLSVSETEERRALTPSAPEEEVQWLPLHHHPVFAPATSGGGAAHLSDSRTLGNLIAWDGASRLYFWDSNQQFLHRLSLRFGDPDPTSVLAASSSKVLKPDVQMHSVVDRISVNRNGSAVLLSGSDGLYIMNLFGRTCAKDNAILCRTVSVASLIYFNNNNLIHILEVLWHPYSDTHFGVLSSDSIFRLFDLSSSVEKPEQEYYLQPVRLGRCQNAASLCPVGFSFGGDHLWDRFSVFVLFSDGSIYILCPVVPFGSVYRCESIGEIYNDAQIFCRKASNSRAVNCSSLAISWLEATFPEIVHQADGKGRLSALKARPYVPLDASLSLQGPLRKIFHDEGEDSEVNGAECEGCAVGFLYNVISKDSVLVTAWSSGKLEIYALADEIEAVWNVGSPPRLRVDSHDRIVGLAMICEPNPDEHSILKLLEPLDHTVWLGHPPLLLKIGVVDLALPGKTTSGYFVSMLTDPLVPERIYCLHGGGIDSIMLHFLPFTSQTGGKDEAIRAPSVYPILSTCQGENCHPAPLCGFVALADSFGYSWIVGVTSSRECIVLEMRSWNCLHPLQVDMKKKSNILEDQSEVETPDIISKELLTGPTLVVVPQASLTLHSVAADSIEGRSVLHQYSRLFHENYVEYAHKVYFELKHHAPHLKRIIDDQHTRLSEANKRLLKVEEKQKSLDDRLNRAVQVHNFLEEHLQSLRSLPGFHKKPLSKAERDFKSELDRFTGVDLDALRSSIEASRGRLRRYMQFSQGNASNRPRQLPRSKNYVTEAQISQLRSSIAKLSLINKENSNKVKLVESSLKGQENTN